MSAVRAPQKTTGEILTATLIQTAAMAQKLAELLSQVARLARVLEEHQSRSRGSFRRTVH
jgi:hypothetical protein